MISYQNTAYFFKEIKKPYVFLTSVVGIRAIPWRGTSKNSFRVDDEEGEDTHSQDQGEHDGSVECPDRMTYVSSCIMI